MYNQQDLAMRGLIEQGGRAKTDNLLIVRHQEAANTAGGTNGTASAWTTRPLNTVLHNSLRGSSLVSNVITLPPGTYALDFRSITYRAGPNQARFQNTTAGETVAYGLGIYAVNTQETNLVSTGSGYVKIDKTSKFELQHKAGTQRATDGWGNEMNIGDNEVYAEVVIRKLP